MNLQRRIQLGGWAILAALALALVVAGVGIQEIRFGGPQHRAEQQMDALEADLLPPPLYIVESWLEATLAVEDPSQREARLANLARQRKDFEDRKDYWRKAAIDEHTRHELRATTEAADAFWQTLDSELVPALNSGDQQRIKAAHDRLATQFDQHRQLVHTALTQVDSSKAETAATATRVLVITLIVLSLVAGGLVGLVLYSRRYLNREVIDPLATAATAMTRMAGGDLDSAAGLPDRDDEIGALTRALGVFRQSALDRRSAERAQREVVDGLSAALDRLADGDLTYQIETPFAEEYEALRLGYNGTIAQLAGLLQQVSGSAASVATGSREIRAASDDLALRNEQQAASLEETAAAMNQVTAIVRQTAQGAAKVQQAIGAAHHEATEGGETVAQAVAAMQAIEQGAREITQIINVIDGIAFQTNLLALNAGVEAARAGDAGKGFAVVANEVRALAQRSADAARDIKALITGSTEQVEGGVRLVNETGALLTKIVGSVGEISASVAEMAKATENQSISLEQVNASIGEMDRMTQQNAAMVEQSTAAARSLADEASTLSDQVGQFRTGHTTGAPVAAIRARKAPASRPLPTRGNLALKADPVADADDWSEF